jgi:DNA-binding MarR family transcriptional regulator
MSPSRNPSDLPAGLADRLGFLLGRAHAAHSAVVASELAPLGIGPKELGALAVLADEGPLSQQRLGARQGVDRTTMVAVVDVLERRGFVERRRDAGDRRAYALHATAAGRRALARATAVAERAEEEFLAPLPPRERERLKRLLRRLLAP